MHISWGVNKQENAQFVRIANTAELPEPGQVKEFDVDGHTVCVASVDGAFSALDNVCVHRGAALGQGSVECGKIVCPWHGWAFDPLTGAASHDTRQRVAVYEIRIEGDDVFVSRTPIEV